MDRDAPLQLGRKAYKHAVLDFHLQLNNLVVDEPHLCVCVCVGGCVVAAVDSIFTSIRISCDTVYLVDTVYLAYTLVLHV